MITATARPNPIMGQAMLCWDWVSVVMELAPSSLAGPQGWDLPVLDGPQVDVELSSNVARKV
jgi:hypothetical protein